MLKKLPPFLKGVFVFTTMVFATIFIVGLPLVFFSILKLLLTPIRPLRQLMDKPLTASAELWVDIWHWLYNATQDTVWDIQVPDDLDRHKSYFIMINHVSGTDVWALTRAFQRRIPLVRFFIKRALFFIPIVGTSCWAMDMPFMRRYTRAQKAKNPRLKGIDLETTRRKCLHLRDKPVTIVNFSEGTRFRYEKYDKQQSPYRYLLRPKAGGVALVTSILGEQIEAILECTLVYPEGKAFMWDFWCGRTPRIVMHVKKIPLPTEFLGGDYVNDAEFKDVVQTWLHDRWQKKDAEIAAILHPDGENSPLIDKLPY